MFIRARGTNCQASPFRAKVQCTVGTSSWGQAKREKPSGRSGTSATVFRKRSNAGSTCCRRTKQENKKNFYNNKRRRRKKERMPTKIFSGCRRRGLIEVSLFIHTGYMYPCIINFSIQHIFYDSTHFYKVTLSIASQWYKATSFVSLLS